MSSSLSLRSATEYSEALLATGLASVAFIVGMVLLIMGGVDHE